MVPSTEELQIGDYIAVQDNPLCKVYWIHKILKLTDEFVGTQILGARSPVLASARFTELWELDNQLYQQKPRRGKPTLWTAQLPVASLPEMIIARNLEMKSGITTSGRLTKASVAVLNALPGMIVHADISGDLSRYL